MPRAESTRHDSSGETPIHEPDSLVTGACFNGTSWMNSAFAEIEHFRMNGAGELFQGLDDSRAWTIQ